jgi:hypothetical protein
MKIVLALAALGLFVSAITADAQTMRCRSYTVGGTTYTTCN